MATFRSYKPEQAKQYAALRQTYPPLLYKHILDEHGGSGGSFGLLLDVGCGPGLATPDLAVAFDRAMGVDPGEQMINVARERGGETKTGEKIRYEIGEAERLASVSGVPLGEVDLITAATAAHWFDMKKFWEQAAQVLRPNGTVAIWIRGEYYAHPDMEPLTAKLREIQDDVQRALEPYMEHGNLLAQNMYDELELPWMADPSQTAFPKDKFRRVEWDRGGLSDGKDFLGGSQAYPLDLAAKVMETASPVTRWREAHPEIAGTEDDCILKAVRQMKDVLGERLYRAGSATALLMFKRA